MEIKYVFTQKRREFGSPCRFTDVGPHLLVDIPSDDSLSADYITLPHIDKAILCRSEISLHEVNTVTPDTESRGMNHEEGGWPADVDHRDEDQVGRFKKKLEKDEGYIASVKNLADVAEKIIMENNALNIYEEYFQGESASGARVAAMITNVYRDFCTVPRSVFDIAWNADGSKIAAAYVPHVFKVSAAGDRSILNCFMWDIDNPVEPSFTLEPENIVLCFSLSHVNRDSLVGGYDNGQIALWDIRKSKAPVQHTPIKSSHVGIVSDVEWIDSKCGTEFISVSKDGQVMSWDSRDLSEPTSKLTIDPNEIGCSMLQMKHTVSSLDYDETIPDGFIIGTYEGVVVSINRRCTPDSEKVIATYETDSGPILCIERNPFIPKLLFFATGLEIFLWSEDYPQSPLLELYSSNGYVTDACWCQDHPSIIYVTKTTGCIEVWDITLKITEPIDIIKLEVEPMTAIKPSLQERNVACGAFTGKLYLMRSPTPLEKEGRNDRLLLSWMIDRETKKEHIVLPKSREDRYKDEVKIKEDSEARRKKEMEIPLTWAPEEKGELLYEELAKLEFGSGFLNQAELEEDEERRAEATGIEPEFGEKVFLETMGREVQTKSILEKTLVQVVTDVESDNSRFPFREIQVDEEFGEQEFLDDLERVGSSNKIIDELLKKVSKP